MHAQYYSHLKTYRRAYTLATQNIPMDWSLFTTSSSRYASLCKVLSRIPLWYMSISVQRRGVLTVSVIKVATLRSRREVPWTGCRLWMLPIPILLFCLSPVPFGLSDSLKQPFLTWGPRTTWGIRGLGWGQKLQFSFHWPLTEIYLLIH